MLAFALVPAWYRLPASPLTELYMARFALLLPMLAAVALWLAAGLPGLAALRRDPVRRTFAFALLAFAAWTFASQAWAEHAMPARNLAAQWGVIALFALVCASAAPRPAWIVAALAFGVVWNGALAHLQVQNGGWLGLRALGEFPYTLTRGGASILQADGLRYFRPYGLMPHPNLLAGFLAFGTVALVGLALHRPPRMGRVVTVALWAAFAVGTWGLLLTFSRAAWIGVAVGGLVLAAIAWRGGAWRRVIPFAAVAAVVGAAFVAQYAPFVLARGGVGAESVEMRSVADRLVYTEFALRAIREHPVLGVGAGNFPHTAAVYLTETFYDLQGDYVHNIALAAWAETGAVGFALLGAALACGLLAGRGMRGAGLLAGVVTLLVIGMFDHYPYSVLHFGALLWGGLGVAMRGSDPSGRPHAG